MEEESNRDRQPANDVGAGGVGSQPRSLQGWDALRHRHGGRTP